MWDGSGREGGEMRRKLFSSAALLSLLLCFATVVLWVRSYSFEDMLISEPRWDSSGDQAGRNK
jgi:hypothetical protein